MELSRETVKRIKGLIVFAALVVACLWKYDVVVSVLAFIFHVIFPFVLGGAIAFILNVPMNFIQRHLFAPERVERHKIQKKIGQYADRNIRSVWHCGTCNVCFDSTIRGYIL